jgi:DNA mismatch repair protein MutL
VQIDPALTDLAASGRQELVVPVVVELTAGEMAVLAPLLPELAALGIEAEAFGPVQLAVRAYPAALRRCDWGRFFAELAADGATDRAVGRLGERIGHRIACHAAVKANQELSPAEQVELVRLLYRIEGLEHCPHGRPTTLNLTWDDLSRRFQR